MVKLIGSGCTVFGSPNDARRGRLNRHKKTRPQCACNRGQRAMKPTAVGGRKSLNDSNLPRSHAGTPKPCLFVDVDLRVGRQASPWLTLSPTSLVIWAAPYKTRLLGKDAGYDTLGQRRKKTIYWAPSREAKAKTPKYTPYNRFLRNIDTPTIDFEK